MMHLICPPPPPPTQMLHNLCISFLLCITAVPRETEHNAYAKCLLGVGGANKVHYGKCGSGEVQKTIIQQFSMLCPLIDHRNDVKLFKTLQ